MKINHIPQQFDHQIMEGQSNGSLSGQQCLEIKLEGMLQKVDPPEMYECNKQCIYRVPQRLREINPKAYTPQIVSIGPFHKASNVGKEDNILESMEELKLKYLKGFLTRTKLDIKDLLSKLRGLEEEIRSYYEGPIEYNSDDFLKMVLIDACFIVEHLMRWIRYKDWVAKDPVLQKRWLLNDIIKELILLENQLPFFVLEHLYNLANDMNQEFPSFLKISFVYFKTLSYGTVCPGERPKHFTDLVRTCMILPSEFQLREHGGRNKIRHLYSASQLMEAGLKFKISQSRSIVDLNYDSAQGVLTMPILTIHDDTELIFRNIVAFEHCHFPDTAVIHQYQRILDFLINTEKDVNVLVDKKIIVNLMGDANEVATMVNRLGLNALMPSFNKEYFSLCNSLNDFYENPRNKYKAIFIHEYFNTPWKIASTVAAVVLLLLTLIQTICSIISLF